MLDPIGSLRLALQETEDDVLPLGKHQQPLNQDVLVKVTESLDQWRFGEPGIPGRCDVMINNMEDHGKSCFMVL